MVTMKQVGALPGGDIVMSDAEKKPDTISLMSQGIVPCGAMAPMTTMGEMIEHGKQCTYCRAWVDGYKAGRARGRVR
jgi:hypothetical protein